MADGGAPPPNVPPGRTGSWVCNAGLGSGQIPSYQAGCVYALNPTAQETDNYHTAQARYNKACKERANRRTVTLAGYKRGRPRLCVQQKCTLQANECCDGKYADQGYLTAKFDGLCAGDSIWFFNHKECRAGDLAQSMPFLPRVKKTNGMAIVDASQGSQQLRVRLPRDRAMSAQIRRTGDLVLLPGDRGGPTTHPYSFTPGSPGVGSGSS